MNRSPDLDSLYSQIHSAFTLPESDAIHALEQPLRDAGRQRISEHAQRLISDVRAQHPNPDLFQAFLREYSLNSSEGVALMSIAEALLRIPDAATQNRFLQDKLADGDWRKHLGHGDSLLIKLASGALSVGGAIEHGLRDSQRQLGLIAALLERLGEPLLRTAIARAMQYLARHFVIAETIADAIAYGQNHAAYRYSFDMLGEAALTEDDAERYFVAYQDAIAALAGAAHADLFANPGISVKLSALYPRYEPLQQRHAQPAIVDKLLSLARQAQAANIGLTIDAEEAERLAMSLDIFAEVFSNPEFSGWPGLGLAVQAYQKRALAVIAWLAALAESRQCRIPLRLVKGAYWDSEIKRAQENGWDDYPVFSRKAATDLSYLACAKAMLDRPLAFYPQFATHNAHSVAAILEMGKSHPGYEFQRLHGMGQALYDTLLADNPETIRCRVYAPVGAYRDLLPYLVRRLLENGANSSFVHQLENPAISAAVLAADPLSLLQQDAVGPMLPPPQLFKERKNSQGFNLSNLLGLRELQAELDRFDGRVWHAAPLVDGRSSAGERYPVYSPFDRRMLVGNAVDSAEGDMQHALDSASAAFPSWNTQPVAVRAACLQRAADLLETHRVELLALCMREGGRCLRDAMAEVREAVDLCRYYAASALDLFGQEHVLPGPVGETNRLCYSGRGVFVCISPWNFPLAICLGQIAAALVAGNTVIAKPAQQTALIATLGVHLLHQAGVPADALHCLPGEGGRIGRVLLNDPRVAGVAFTGSGAIAALINRQLSQRPGAIASFIAETGGQNVMIADSSAHEEQLIGDVLQSAFNSAGQRCSSVRVLFLPEETADRVIERLIGAMRLLRIGSPLDFATDVGPIIDSRAVANLQAHLERIKPHAKWIYQMSLAAEAEHGSFFAPILLEIPSLALLEQEVFGPILHVIRYRNGALEQVVADINATGYGLTLGLHTRIDSTIEYVTRHARVGNIYVNRNTIGAVVGVQPFGGLGLSGTGPKAGGPNYLYRFAAEQTVTTNIAAMGGNPWLLSVGSRPDV